jgi:hypothetical protein
MKKVVVMMNGGREEGEKEKEGRWRLNILPV